jgi:biopolymer transport protein TolR
MAFSTAGGGPSRPEMNVTPLIDILLVLIIVFMVIVATSKEYVVNTQLPEESKGEQPHQNERTIVIQIIWSPQQKAPLLKINKESVPWDDLEPTLARIFLSRAEKLAYVKGDNDLDFEYVAQVIAEAHNAGITRVGLLTKELDDTR